MACMLHVEAIVAAIPKPAHSVSRRDGLHPQSGPEQSVDVSVDELG